MPCWKWLGAIVIVNRTGSELWFSCPGVSDVLSWKFLPVLNTLGWRHQFGVTDEEESLRLGACGLYLTCHEGGSTRWGDWGEFLWCLIEL